MHWPILLLAVQQRSTINNEPYQSGPSLTRVTASPFFQTLLLLAVKRKEKRTMRATHAVETSSASSTVHDTD